MMKRKVIEIIKEADVENYQLQKIKGMDYLNLQEVDFEPSIWNVFLGRTLDEFVLIKTPHNVNVGDIVELDDTLNVKKVIKSKNTGG